MPATNQKASGRCWIFAGMNVLREIIAKKLNLDEMKKYIEKIDFTNYLSVRRIKKEENV